MTKRKKFAVYLKREPMLLEIVSAKNKQSAKKKYDPRYWNTKNIIIKETKSLKKVREALKE